MVNCAADYSVNVFALEELAKVGITFGAAEISLCVRYMTCVNITYGYDISAQPLTYNTQQQEVGDRTVTYETTSSRRLKIRLDVSLLDRDSGKIIWSDNSMEEEARFEVGFDPLVNRYNQKQALLIIARKLAKRVYLKTMERF